MKTIKVSVYLKVLLLVVIASVVTGIYSYLISTGEIEELLNTEAEQISQRTAQSLAFPFWNLDSVGVTEIIDAQMQNSNMYAITLQEKTALKQFVAGMIKPENGEIKEITSALKKEYPFSSTAPILFEGEELGTVTVILTDKVLRSFLLRNQTTQSLFQLIILLLLTIPLSFMIANSFIIPVEKLALAFQTVVKNQFKTAAPPVAERELTNLSEIFEKVRLTQLESLALIRQNEKDLTITLNSISDGIIAVDRDQNIIRLNPIAEKLVGNSTDGIAGKPLKDVLHLEPLGDNETSEKMFERILAPSENAVQLRGIIQDDGDEKKYTVDITSSQILNEDGGFGGIVLVIRDVTEMIKVEEELKQRRKMESLGQLSGGVAHDFNNMLGGIIGFSDLLMNTLSKESEEYEYVHNILDAANSAADLTAKLLAFSRKGKMVSTPFNLHKSCETAISLLSRTINRNISINSNFTAEHEYVTGDPSQLQNAILNLCINAKDAMPNGGDLILTSRNVELLEDNEYHLESGMYIFIDITDTGTGIPDSIQAKIFEPFFTTKDTGKGTGLGLAAVYGAVQNHHGTVALRSKEGEGTTFTVILPVEVGIFEDSTTRISSNITELDKRILIVDDEKIIRIMVDKVVSDLGGITMQASDGVEGVALFREKHNDIDLVILDMVMPHMNGDECYRMMKEIDPSVPVLLASGFDKNTSISELLEEGAAGYLHKPFAINELTMMMHNLTKNKLNE